jgi:hypothetical protein
VDDFPRGTARSVDGALHIRPGGTKKLTKTELEHLQKTQPWGRLIRVIKKVVPTPPASQSVKAARAQEQAAKAASTPSIGGTKIKPKKVAGREGNPEE